MPSYRFDPLPAVLHRFENITDDEVDAVMNKLNHRPRKTFNFKTPHKVFFAEPLQEAA